jgi:hypothetical protein
MTEFYKFERRRPVEGAKTVSIDRLLADDGVLPEFIVAELRARDEWLLLGKQK